MTNVRGAGRRGGGGTSRDSEVTRSWTRVTGEYHHDKDGLECPPYIIYSAIWSFKPKLAKCQFDSLNKTDDRSRHKLKLWLTKFDSVRNARMGEMRVRVTHLAELHYPTLDGASPPLPPVSPQHWDSSWLHLYLPPWLEDILCKFN